MQAKLSGLFSLSIITCDAHSQHASQFTLTALQASPGVKHLHFLFE
jgi:hypothetical protein